MSLSPRLQYTENAACSLSQVQINARDRVRSKIKDGTYSVEPAPCFCNSEKGIVIAECDRYGLPVTTVLCPECGLLRTSPRFSAQSANRFYEEDFVDLYRGNKDPEELFQNRINWGKSLLVNLAPLMGEIHTVYEVGCGSGGILVPFLEAGCEVVGCDPGQQSFSLAQKQGIRFVQGGARQLLQAYQKPADLVILCHVLEHFADLRTELADIKACLRPGGFLAVAVPGIRIIPKSYRSDLRLYLQIAHNFHFTATTLTYVLQSAGFEVLFVDENSFALACVPNVPLYEPPQSPKFEALSVLHFLAALEKDCLRPKMPLMAAF